MVEPSPAPPASPPRQLYCGRCLTTFTEEREDCPNLGCARPRPPRGWGSILNPGELFDRTYRIHRMLAVGGAGVTYLARETDAAGEESGPRIAIKVLLSARDQGPYVRRLNTEAQILQELDHPNIVQYLGFVHRTGHSPYLMTRFEAGGSLLDHMRRVGTLRLLRTATIGRQICWALEKAHERGIVHRDLKPENVLLSRIVSGEEDPVVRVADFGIAKVQAGVMGGALTRQGAFVGTPHYAAPEQFIGGPVTESADVYAVGALMYFCLTARHVARFADRLDPEEGFQLLVENLPPRLDLPQEEAETVRRLQLILSWAMQVEAHQRCTVLELDRMLEDLLAGRDPSPPQPRSAAQETGGPSRPGPLHMHALATTPVATQQPTHQGMAPPARQMAPIARSGDDPTRPVDKPTTVDERSAGAGLLAAAALAGAGVALAANALSSSPPAPAPSPAPPPQPTPPPQPSAQGTAPAEPPATLTAQPSSPPATPSQPSLAGHTSVQPYASQIPASGPSQLPPPSSGGGKAAVMGVVGLVTGLGVALAAVVVAAGGLYYFAPQWQGGASDKGTEEAPVVPLLERDSDPTHRKDLEAIQRSFHTLHTVMQKRCKVPSGTRVGVELIVEPDGTARSARAVSGEQADYGPCVAGELSKARFGRAPGANYAAKVRLEDSW